MPTAKNDLIIGVLFLFLVAFSGSLTYLVSQQVLRLGANEVPVQLATDTALKLQKGQSAGQAIPAEKVDIARSLSGFVMVYDNQQKLLATSGMLNNAEPAYPNGVLDYAAKHEESSVTWQPKVGLRFASVALKTDSGYVVAARSLRETEKLIDKVGRLVLLAWLTTLLFAAAAWVVILFFMKKLPRQS